MSNLNNMTVIDGAQGEGGGQIFRSTLTLAMCLGKAVRIENIRAGRKKPGLLRQHLVCLKAAQEICDAEVSGAELGSSVVTFSPNEIKAGKYAFAIGSAGSTTLVFQTILLPLAMAEKESEVCIQGGTHNGMAPSYDFVKTSFLPVLRKMGCEVDTAIEKYGFYPAGGGKWTATISAAATLDRLELVHPGEQLGQWAVATSALISSDVTKRELAQVRKRCGWTAADGQQRLVESVGPGNILSLQVQMEHVTEVFEAVGERNLSSERVADKAVKAVHRYLSAGVAVGEHLADQLILPMALGSGGRFHTLKPSQHLLTNIDVVRMLTGVQIDLTEIRDDCWEVSVQGGGYFSSKASWN